MKKLKNLLLTILILITCTGCSVEYNININSDTIEETINVTDYITTNRTGSEILKHYNTWYPTFVNYIKEGESIEIKNFNEKVSGIEYHDKKINNINNGYKYTYKYTYEIDEYYDSYVLASIFADTRIHKEKDKLVIRTSKENFLCDYDYFESATVNIKIDPSVYKLNHTNTNNIKNNTYTWVINRNNCQNSEIVLTLDKAKKNIDEIISEDNDNNKVNNDNQKETIIKKISNYEMYIFCAILIILIFIGNKIFTKIKNKNNKFNEDD